MQKLMDKIVSLCKRRGIIFQGSEIYGGFGGFWDYGPLGVELKNNIKREWWKSMVYNREDVVGIDAAIVMNPDVWKASGHIDAFTDPLVECKNCHHRFRADKIESENCPDCGGKMTESKKFNLLTEVYIGTTEDAKKKAYLRGEITQGVFVNFINILNSTRIRIPFGVAQIGKAFRNEITPGNFTYRSREFEQMELEYFIKPSTDSKEMFDYWKNERIKWYISLGMTKDNLRFREHLPNERAHYAKYAEDIEYKAPFGWSEFEGIHHRGDWDLTKHKLSYKDNSTNETFIPWVIEVSGGVDRSTLFFLIDSYYEEGKRVILKLHPKIAPYKVAVFPLVANKPELNKKARDIYLQLKKLNLPIIWDDRGNIGKRYFSQDEIGTPWCITIDYDTLEDDTVTLRDRDTAKQVRIKISGLELFILDKLK